MCLQIYFLFLKVITYRTHSNSTRTKEDVVTVFETSTSGVSSHAVEDIRVNLIVPSIPPTDYVTSNICKVGYTIKVSTGILCPIDSGWKAALLVPKSTSEHDRVMPFSCRRPLGTPLLHPVSGYSPSRRRAESVMGL